jgi:hypothetical protein
MGVADGYEYLTNGGLATQRANLEVDDFPGDHQREELLRWSRDGSAHGFPDLHGHLSSAGDHFIHMILVLVSHVVESRRLEELGVMQDTGVLGGSGRAGHVL